MSDSGSAGTDLHQSMQNTLFNNLGTSNFSRTPTTSPDNKKVPDDLRGPSRIKPPTSNFLDKVYVQSNGLCFQNMADAMAPMCVVQWRAPVNDTSIPQTEDDHRKIAKQLVSAFKDMKTAKDTLGNAYRKRLTPGMQEYYSDWAVEACAWDVLVSLSWIRPVIQRFN